MTLFFTKYFKLPTLSLFLFVTIINCSVTAEEFNVNSQLDLNGIVTKGSKLGNLFSPSKNNNIYINDDAGKLFLIKDRNLATFEQFDLTHYYPNLLSLNAFAFHPNFFLSQQVGSLTFYTSHIEPADKNKRTKKIIDKQIAQPLLYEIVIIEWKVEQATNLKVVESSRREVVRIPTQNPNNHVAHIGFNANVKPWNNNFGYLFIALKNVPELKESPLYAGAILRINPNKFGSRSYTVPSDNPFIDNASIMDEVLITGAENLVHFEWQKNKAKELIYSRNTDNTQEITTISYGSNSQDKSIKTSLTPLNSTTSQHNFIVIRNNSVAHLRNKILFLKWDNQWIIESLSPNAPRQREHLFKLDNKEFSKDSKLSIFATGQGSFTLLDHNKNIIHTVTIKESINSTQTKATTTESHTNQVAKSNNSWVWILSIASIFALFIFVKFKKFKENPRENLKKTFCKIQAE